MKYRKFIRIRTKKGEKIKYTIETTSSDRLYFAIAQLRWLYEKTTANKNFVVGGR